MLSAKSSMIIERKNWPILSKFILVGVLNTVLGYTLFGLLIYFKFYYLLALTISHIVGTINSFLWNRFFTFKSQNKISQEILKFVISYSFIYLLNFFLLFLSVSILKLNVYYSQIVILIFVVITSFSLQRNWTFKIK